MVDVQMDPAGEKRQQNDAQGEQRGKNDTDGRVGLNAERIEQLNRLTRRRRVLFPAPLKPMMPKISPSLTVRLTSLTAATSRSLV